MGRFGGDPPRIVFDSREGSRCPSCGGPPHRGACEAEDPAGAAARGPVRVRVERAGRRGKTVTLVEGLALDGAGLEDLLRTLKRECGCGGSLEGTALAIQGDQRDRIAAALRDRGYAVKT